jgi:hypothetical protein
MCPAGNWENSQGISVDHHSSTYPVGVVALESAGVDLDICTRRVGHGINCTTLRVVVCPAPGIGAENQDISQNSFGYTYTGGSVAPENTVMHLHIATIGINSSTLEVACPPPGIGAKI